MAVNFLLMECVMYHRFFGEKLSEVEIKELSSKNLLRSCAVDVKPCTPHEGSRVDGTCNNFRHPARGSAQGPYLRMLKPDYARSESVYLRNLTEKTEMFQTSGAKRRWLRE
ncbi:hypothetical protein EVAR_50408_1 [Eumeta japonica]|uniref:Uncharacterized protein n=1 Tax=Eumeta variegata TaxID=151549 RepID=A0A4C1WY19_EUMVA|nr:hypothetical protein EVAR_50408_1 [Eumeta japonica]